MIQFQNESVVVKLVNNATAIYLTWNGTIPSSRYREGLEKSLEIARKHHIRDWISDISLMQVIGAKDLEWVNREWLPNAVLTGCYKNQAVIVDGGMGEKASALNTHTTIKDQPIEIRHFTRLKDARKWLENSSVHQMA